MLNSINDLIGKRRAELLGQETDIRYWKLMALKGVKNAEINVVNTTDTRDNNIKALKTAEELKQEINAGKWDVIEEK